MILIDPRLLEQLEGSTCFGIAHDPTVKECKMCDLQQECVAKTASNRLFDPIKVLRPETEEALTKAKLERETTSDAEKSSERKEERKEKPKRAKEEMPDLKGMTISELEELLAERGGTCDFYQNPAVYKMRLSLAIKNTY